MNLFRNLFTTHRFGRKLGTAQKDGENLFADAPKPIRADDSARAPSLREERRTPGKLVEDLVEYAVEMRELEGTQEARSFLRFSSVPPAVIRRVLSSTAQRRQTRAR